MSALVAGDVTFDKPAGVPISEYALLFTGTIKLSSSYTAAGDSLTAVFPKDKTLLLMFFPRGASANEYEFDQNSHVAVAMVRSSGVDVAATTDLSATTMDFVALILRG